MQLSRTNISVNDNVGIRRNVNIHIGSNGSYPSGDILDANATKELIDKVAVTGDYNDLENKPTIPNVAVVNLEMEDLNTSATPFTITNQDKISLVCDLMDAGTVVFGTLPNNGIKTPAIWAIGGTYPTQATLCVDAFVPLIDSGSPFGGFVIACQADVTSRYVTSNTEP